MQLRAREGREIFGKANINAKMSLHYISYVKDKKNASSLGCLTPKPGYWFSSQLEFEIRILKLL